MRNLSEILYVHRDLKCFSSTCGAALATINVTANQLRLEGKITSIYSNTAGTKQHNTAREQLVVQVVNE